MPMQGGGRITEPCRVSQDHLCRRTMHTGAGHGRKPQARYFRHLVQRESTLRLSEAVMPGLLESHEGEEPSQEKDGTSSLRDGRHHTACRP